MGDPKENGSRTRALERGLSAVEVLTTNGPAPLATLRENTGLSNATLLRILQTLEHCGWVARSSTDGRYELAPKIESFIAGRLHVNPMVEIARATLSRLPDHLNGWPSEIAAPIAPGQTAVLASNHDLTSATKMARRHKGDPEFGVNAPMTLSSHGRVALAFSDGEERAGHLNALMQRGRREERRWIEKGLLHSVLKEARARGYALREYDYWVEPYDFGPDIDSLAVPVLVEGEFYATLSIVWTMEAADRSMIIRDHLDALREAADEIADHIRLIGLAPPQFFQRPASSLGGL
jgi:IclR family mhp operon transcriptional activator